MWRVGQTVNQAAARKFAESRIDPRVFLLKGLEDQSPTTRCREAKQVHQRYYLMPRDADDLRQMALLRLCGEPNSIKITIWC